MSDDLQSKFKRARNLVKYVLDNHSWQNCGFQRPKRSLICPVLERELVIAIARELAKEPQ